MTGEDLEYAYYFKLYDVYSDWHRLRSTTTTEYTPAGNVISKVDYDYNLANKLINRETRWMSDGSLIIKRDKYPNDYSSTAGNIFESMVLANQLNKPIETQLWRKQGAAEYLTGSSITEYKAFANNKFISPYKSHQLNVVKPIPSSFVGETSESTAPASSLLPASLSFDMNSEFDYDENGRVVQITQPGGIIKSYVWGYNNEYPVAEISNVAYSSLAGILNASVIQNPSSMEAMIMELNKLRTSFPSKLITTYTYNPLAGITSVTDAKGISTYYEYDGNQRLKSIKDREGNILKSFDYHYKPSN
jgi:YD repeat-containing protein